MIVSKLKDLLRPIRKVVRRNSTDYLEDIRGIVHVGANTGQERSTYRAHGLHVIWIEPIPDVFEQLSLNLRDYSDQIAIHALVTDVDDKDYDFHVSNNEGASSSILDLKEHRDIWPDVDFTSTINLKSITLATLYERHNVEAAKYSALTIDTQGSELLVLQGSIPLLPFFKFIKIEVPDFESYEGCCQLSDIEAFMMQHGYKEFYREQFASRARGGSYFDIIYKQQKR